MSTASGQDPVAVPQIVLAEVKYSLPQMLAEIKYERSAGTFGMEKLDQQEIQKLFKAKAPRRVKIKK